MPGPTAEPNSTYRVRTYSVSWATFFSWYSVVLLFRANCLGRSRPTNSKEKKKLFFNKTIFLWDFLLFPSSTYLSYCMLAGWGTHHKYIMSVGKVNHLGWVPMPVCIQWPLGRCSRKPQPNLCSQQTLSDSEQRCFPLTQKQTREKGISAH